MRHWFFFLWWMDVQAHISALSHRPVPRWNEFCWLLREIILNMDGTWWTVAQSCFFFASQYAFKWLCGLLVFYSVRYCRIVFPLNQFNARLLKLGLICADVWCHVFALCHPHAVSFLIQIKHHFTHLHRRSIISASATASACCVTLTFFFCERQKA